MVANSYKTTRRDRIDRPSAFNLCMNTPVRWIRVPVWPSEPTSWGKVSHIGARFERSGLGALSSRLVQGLRSKWPLLARSCARQRASGVMDRQGPLLQDY
ncbi:hypothetical protein CPSG_05037 [Coccidioides posadasii str. Silveira]|uniref:Uncharacterized protein n=2 Tax=Coccidioides posadasii TaxID=199306 RepID=E9D607_COCPS|nr:hypothetical protein CPSG_05037 [Coccidioides posadasii str. Silveira]KMM66268.1 hypothetical protein CPAG_02608 [Coccidioides posadasii RMSCC 3488]